MPASLEEPATEARSAGGGGAGVLLLRIAVPGLGLLPVRAGSLLTGRPRGLLTVGPGLLTVRAGGPADRTVRGPGRAAADSRSRAVSGAAAGSRTRGRPEEASGGGGRGAGGWAGGGVCGGLARSGCSGRLVLGRLRSSVRRLLRSPEASLRRLLAGRLADISASPFVRPGAQSGLPRISPEGQSLSRKGANRAWLPRCYDSRAGSFSLYHPPGVWYRFGPTPVPKGEPPCDALVTPRPEVMGGDPRRSSSAAPAPPRRCLRRPGTLRRERPSVWTTIASSKARSVAAADAGCRSTGRGVPPRAPTATMPPPTSLVFGSGRLRYISTLPSSTRSGIRVCVAGEGTFHLFSPVFMSKAMTSLANDPPRGPALRGDVERVGVGVDGRAHADVEVPAQFALLAGAHPPGRRLRVPLAAGGWCRRRSGRRSPTCHPPAGRSAGRSPAGRRSRTRRRSSPA
ncbi:hypothetical protein SBADM41S_01092 [Streptomyces badius]